MKRTIGENRRLARIIHNFRNKRLLVLGDIMLDRYIWGDVSRISPEAPVPVVAVQSSSTVLGGAGNVAQNLLSLGSIPILAGVVGNDEEGRRIRRGGGENRGIFIDRLRPTTVKTRIIAHHQQVARVDLEAKDPLPVALESKIVDFIRNEAYDGLIVSDYNKGLINSSLMGKILPHAHQRRIPVFVDPKMEHFTLFSPVTLVTPNHFEVEKMVRRECRSDAEAEKAGWEIFSLISSRYLIVKRGEQGMTVFEKGKPAFHIPTVAREVFDVTGAGDTVIAAAALALLAGATIEEAASIANMAAGIVVGKIGTATVSPQELLAAL